MVGGWVGTGMAAGLLARLWKGRSALLWALIALVLYGIIEDPPVGVLLEGGRPPPWREHLPDMVFSTLIVAALVALALAVLPARHRGQGRSGGRRRKRGDGGSPSAGPVAELMLCPTCVETIRADAAVCPYCGHKFAASSDAAATTERPSPPPR